MRNVMVDLETVGMRPGCGILSIGAVFFDNKGVGQEFYQVVNMKSCSKKLGFHADQSTLDWWKNQSAEAKKAFEQSEAGEGIDITDGLTQFNAFLRTGTESPKVWGNGADFDNAILAVAYALTGVKVGWKPYDGRCYRTLKGFLPANKLQRTGTFHNALDDAKSQAAHAITLLNALAIKV